MTNSPKIDISAIMNKKKNSNSPKKDELEDKIEEENLSTNNWDDIISIPEKTEKPKVEEIIPKSPRISLWSIKTSKSNEEKNEIIEDEKEVEETIIQSTETKQDKKIVEVKEIKEEVVEEEIADVPFAVIENVPIYPGCEKESGNEAKKKCMSSKISEFINKKFNSDLASDLGLEGRQRIAVQFKIDKNGKVVDVRARAPHPRLEKEAVDVVQSLPDMTPGKQRGKPVGVLYSLPIVFDIQ